MKLTRNSSFRLLQVFCSWFMLAVISMSAIAQPLEDITLKYGEDGVVATINLSGPIQYLRHFPSSHGDTLEIFFDCVQDDLVSQDLLNKTPPRGLPEKVCSGAGKEAWVDNEVRKSPPSRLIPSFTVSTRDVKTQPKLVVEFSREAEYSVSPGSDNRSLLVTIIPDKRPVSTGPLPFLPVIMREPAPVAAEALTPEQAMLAENNGKARALMVQGRDALSKKDNAAAVDAFNKLLLLPPNDYTQDAQEWVGVGRERSGQIDKANIEYDLYLRLYPDGDGAERVAQRLAGLARKEDKTGTVTGGAEKKQAARWMTFGSVSSRYYYGVSTIDSTYTFNNATTTDSITQTDQSMFITSLDVSERYISEDYDGRMVFRDVSTKNFQASQPSQNRVYAAYGEFKDRKIDYSLRLGRQSATGGGVLGRFDGLSGSYGYSPDVRLNAAAGALVDFSQGGSQTDFVSGSVDRGPLSLYAIKQTVDSAIDRRAVGAEYRYFKNNKTVFALIDYDTYFRALNAVQVMGTLPAYGGTLNFLLDSRKAPSLSMRNALNGAGTSSIDTMLQAMMKSSLKKLALARTATSNTGQIGLTVPFREKWQVGGDIRITDTSGLPASGTNALEGILAATPSRGTETGVTTQVIGSGLYKKGDIWSGSLSFNNSSTVNGYGVYFYNHMPYKNGWTVDTSLQFSSQKDQFDAKTARTSPTVRGAYRLMEQLYLDVDGGIEYIDFSGAFQSTKTTRYFTSAGLRLDF